MAVVRHRKPTSDLPQVTQRQVTEARDMVLGAREDFYKWRDAYWKPQLVQSRSGAPPPPPPPSNHPPAVQRANTVPRLDGVHTAPDVRIAAAPYAGTNLPQRNWLRIGRYLGARV